MRYSLISSLLEPKMYSFSFRYSFKYSKYTWPYISIQSNFSLFIVEFQSSTLLYKLFRWHFWLCQFISFLQRHSQLDSQANSLRSVSWFFIHIYIILALFRVIIGPLFSAWLWQGRLYLSIYCTSENFLRAPHNSRFICRIETILLPHLYLRKVRSALDLKQIIITWKLSTAWNYGRQFDIIYWNSGIHRGKQRK
jgi:hypothetical protein